MKVNMINLPFELAANEKVVRAHKMAINKLQEIIRGITVVVDKLRFELATMALVGGEMVRVKSL